MSRSRFCRLWVRAPRIAHALGRVQYGGLRFLIHRASGQGFMSLDKLLMIVLRARPGKWPRGVGWGGRKRPHRDVPLSLRGRGVGGEGQLLDSAQRAAPLTLPFPARGEGNYGTTVTSSCSSRNAAAMRATICRLSNCAAATVATRWRSICWQHWTAARNCPPRNTAIPRQSVHSRQRVRPAERPPPDNRSKGSRPGPRDRGHRRKNTHSISSGGPDRTSVRGHSGRNTRGHAEARSARVKRSNAGPRPTSRRGARRTRPATGRRGPARSDRAKPRSARLARPRCDSISAHTRSIR